jgi:hypothetical protein
MAVELSLDPFLWEFDTVTSLQKDLFSGSDGSSLQFNGDQKSLEQENEPVTAGFGSF